MKSILFLSISVWLHQGLAMSNAKTAKVLVPSTYKFTSKNSPIFSFEIPELKNWKISEQPGGMIYYNPKNIPVKFEVPPSIGFLSEENFNKSKRKELTDWKENPQKIKYKKFFVSGFEKEVLKFEDGKNIIFVLLPENVIEYGLDASVVENSIVRTFNFISKKVLTHIYKEKIVFSFDYPIFDLWETKVKSPTLIEYSPDDSIPTDFYSSPSIAIIFESKLKEHKTKDITDWALTPNKVNYKTIFVSGFAKEALVFKNKENLVVILKIDDVSKHGLTESEVSTTILNSFKFL